MPTDCGTIYFSSKLILLLLIKVENNGKKSNPSIFCNFYDKCNWLALRWTGAQSDLIQVFPCNKLKLIWECSNENTWFIPLI